MIVRIYKYRVLFTDVLLLLIVTFSFQFYFLDAKFYPILNMFRLLITYGFVVFLLIYNRSFKIKIPFLIYLIYLIIWNYGAYLTGADYKNYFLYGVNGLLFLIVLYSDKLKTKNLLNVFDKIFVLFLILMIPAFIINILLLFGFKLDFEYIDLGGRGYYSYRNYYNVAIIRDLVTKQLSFGLFARLSGLFEEPGMLGTYLGNLLIFDYIFFPEKKKRKQLAIFLGLFTFSLALYIYMFFIFVYVSRKKFLKVFIISILSFIIIYAVLPKSLKSVVNEEIIERVGFEYNSKHGVYTLKGDTRSVDHLKFRRYLEKRTTTAKILFGNGYDYNRKVKRDFAYSSFYKIIFEAGIIGFLMVVLFNLYYLVYIPIKYKKISYIILTIVPVLSIYQGRQSIHIISVFLYICLLKFIKQKKTETLNILEKEN